MKRNEGGNGGGEERRHIIARFSLRGEKEVPEVVPWDIPNLWICDGSVFPTVGGVSPSIQAIAYRTADRIKVMAGRGELEPRRFAPAVGPGIALFGGSPAR